MLEEEEESNEPTMEDPDVMKRMVNERCRWIPISGKTASNKNTKVFVPYQDLKKALQDHEKVLSSPLTASTFGMLPQESFTNFNIYAEMYSFLLTSINSITFPLVKPSESSLVASSSSSKPLPPSNNVETILALKSQLSATLISSLLSSIPAAISKDVEVKSKVQSPKESRKMKGEFSCNECGKTFGARRNLYFHERQVHDAKSTVCPECGKPLRNRATLVRHRRTHYGPLEMLHVCPDCNKRCKERRHLIIHCTNLGHTVPPEPSPSFLNQRSEVEEEKIEEDDDLMDDGDEELNERDDDV